MKNYRKITLIALSCCLICSEKGTAKNSKNTNKTPPVITSCPATKGSASLTMTGTFVLSGGGPSYCYYSDGSLREVKCSGVVCEAERSDTNNNWVFYSNLKVKPTKPSYDLSAMKFCLAPNQCTLVPYPSY